MLICVYTFHHVTVRVRERKTRWDQEGAAVARGLQEMSHVLVEGQRARFVVDMLLLHRWACSSLPTAVVILVQKRGFATVIHVLPRERSCLPSDLDYL